LRQLRKSLAQALPAPGIPRSLDRDMVRDLHA
jgi:hypothetical protein